MKSTVKRICVLFTRLSGYMSASLKALVDDHGIELMVFRYAPASNAPFNDTTFSWIDHLYNRSDFSDKQMLEKVLDFGPQGVLMAGWSDKGYLAIAKELRKQNVPVIAGSDAQWHGTLKQYVGSVISPWYLQKSIDKLWVAGERQMQFASRLGFAADRCLNGYYTCNWPQFAEAYNSANGHRKKAFLYVGRYVDVKGIDVLVKAYAKYRLMVKEPWDLVCAGTGVHAGMLANQPGIIDRGFVQPDELPGLMAEASGFVLPSRREPWGVVVQEAAAAGLPLICSDSCGAAVHLLLDQYNGFLFSNEDAEHLAHCMMQLSNVSSDNWKQMSTRSHELSKKYTPKRWAQVFLRGVSNEVMV